MSQGSSVFWNPHERITSADLNLMATMGASLSLQGMRGNLISPDLGGVFTTSFVQGLRVDADGSNPDQVVVDPRGAIWLSSSTDPPIPSGDAGWSSNYRFASTLEAASTPAVFTFPVDASERWYIVEARVVEEDVTGTRDIRNTTTGKFAPQTVVVAKRVGIEIRATRAAGLGVASYPTAAPGWVPLAAVGAVPGGGLIPTSRIIDLRLTPKHVATTQQQTTDFAYGRGRFDFSLASNGDIEGSTVDRILVRGIPVAPGLGYPGSPASMADLVASPAADTTYYLYAVPPGRIPTAVRSDLSRRGIIVASTVAPVLESPLPAGMGRNGGVWVNGGLIPQSAVPNPYKTVQAGVVAGGAVLVGAVRYGASAWVPQQQTDGHVDISGQAWGVQSQAGPFNGSGVAFAFGLPAFIRSYSSRITYGTNAISTWQGYVRFRALRLGANEDWFLPVVNTDPSGGGSALSSFIHRKHDALDVTFLVTQFPTQVNPSFGAVTCSLDSYEW